MYVDKRAFRFDSYNDPVRCGMVFSVDMFHLYGHDATLVY